MKICLQAGGGFGGVLRVFSQAGLARVWEAGLRPVGARLRPVENLQRYCDEFAYRYNTRQISNVERFEDAMRTVSNARITYKGLIGK
jgi:hypothetical protein